MIWDRERYIAHMLFEDTGREFFTELFGPLIGLNEEWAAQGATLRERDLSAFHWDSASYCHMPVRTGAITGQSSKVLEETPEYIISVDEMGRRQKLCKKSATIPLPMDYPVKDMDDWLRVKPWYIDRADRVDQEALILAKTKREGGALTLASIPGGFDEPRQLMGEEALCIAFYEQPELIKDMLHTFATTALKVFERAIQVVPIDNLCIHEDMAGKSGPLAGPSQVREFLAPYYRKIWEPLRASGARLFSQDSDGNMNAVIGEFLEAGVNVFYPFEPNAGMDFVKARAQYGKRFAVKGGLDKFALRGSKEDIERELTYKLCPAVLGGGVIFALDHRIPNGVSIENYRYYVKRGRELLGLPDEAPSPFIRMAF